MNKINVSSMRVLQMLQLLVEKSYTMNELMEALSEVTGERCSNFLVCKYINTCRFCGIDIQKVKGKYMLLKLPFGINFDDAELELIEDMNEFCTGMRVSKTVRGINALLGKLNRRSDRYYTRIALPEDDGNVKCFDNALENGWKVELKYKEGKEVHSVLCDPLELSYENEELAFVVNDNGVRRKIFYDDVKSIKTSSVKASDVSSTSVVFKLKNILAKRYTLRPDEKVVSTEFDGSISVMNRTEDKKALLNRLLKYGDLCEVISPRIYRRDMQELIEKTLSNYQ